MELFTFQNRNLMICYLFDQSIYCNVDWNFAFIHFAYRIRSDKHIDGRE